MPEFPGYDGVASPSLPIIKVKPVTTRTNPILQTNIGPGEEHVNLAGIPTEGSLVQALDEALPGLVTNVYSHPAGGGKYAGILQIHKRDHNDQGRERQAAIVAFGAFPELKHVILVDDDVDIFRHPRRAVGDDDAFPGGKVGHTDPWRGLPSARPIR